MKHVESVGQKGLFNGVTPQGWRLNNRFIFPTTPEETIEIRSMIAMQPSKDGGVAYDRPPRLVYSSIEAAKAALEELQDKTAE
jgi:hypothetical protein